MKKKVFVVFSIITTLIILGLCSCLSNKGSVDAHNSRISLDWDGVYTGTIPSGSGPGIDVRLKLNRDQTYELTYVYLDRVSGQFNWTGLFTWDETGNIIKLDIDNVPHYYKSVENCLIQLDMKGKQIKGKLADNYVLKKER
jgi:uncharacterized lipoprotein NlpE involved in copper resistance